MILAPRKLELVPLCRSYAHGPAARRIEIDIHRGRPARLGEHHGRTHEQAETGASLRQGHAKRILPVWVCQRILPLCLCFVERRRVDDGKVQFLTSPCCDSMGPSVGLSGHIVSFLVPCFPSKSGLIKKHTVKHTVNEDKSVEKSVHFYCPSRGFETYRDNPKCIVFLFSVPRFPSKSGLIHKHIVKHIVNPKPWTQTYRETVQVRTTGSTQTYREA
jgi:hypothetical protein